MTKEEILGYFRQPNAYGRKNEYELAGADLIEQQAREIEGLKRQLSELLPIEEILNREVDMSAHTVCDNSSGVPVISVPSCVPIDEIEYLKHQLSLVTAEFEKVKETCRVVTRLHDDEEKENQELHDRLALVTAERDKLRQCAKECFSQWKGQSIPTCFLPLALLLDHGM